MAPELKTENFLKLCHVSRNSRTARSSATMNKITSFPHTLSLCSKKAESKVKRVKSYYCTRVCQNMPNAQTYMYGVPKLFNLS